jgi:hypothetical protein
LGLQGAAQAIEFTIPFGEEGITAVLNNSATIGAQWRMQERSGSLVGKGNLDPAVCGRQGQGSVPLLTGQDNPYYQSCQGLFRTQSFPAERLTQVPGQYSNNFDDGNLNYDKHDLTQAPFKLTQDLTLTYGDFGFFARTLYFYDHVNYTLEEFHPNRLTRANVLSSGIAVEASNNNGLARDDSRPCGARDRDGNPGTPCGIVYGAGGVVRNLRDGETRRQIGQDLQLLDFVAYGKIPLGGEQELTVKLGRQTVNWGESTLLVINSINQAQPVNANNFTRVGFAVEEVFTPQASLYLSMQPFENFTAEGYYQFQWEPVEIPAKGSFLSFADLGTNNAGDFITSSFGGAAEDQDGVGFLLDNSLSGLTNTSLRVPRLRDNEPKAWGLTNQFGLSFKYFAEWLNNGTELGVYAMNYHSKLPIISAYAATPGCGRDARSTQQFIQDCPDLPILHMPKGEPENATSDPILFDTARIQFEYPENIQMYGLSFNTTLGDFSIQGEVSYRPKLPLQVDAEDLLFMAYGPTLTRCHLQTLNTGDPTRDRPCEGTGNGPVPLPAGVTLPVGLPVGGIGTDPNTGGTTVYPSSDFVIDAAGTKGGYNDTFDLLVGAGVGSARAFPSFVAAYRGFAVGENPNTDPNLPYNRKNPGYIRGYEEMEVYQFGFGATQVLGATDRLNVIGADQILNLLEVGAIWVPGMPALDVLQFDAPGTMTHASAGADGSGADRSRQACSLNPTCTFGVDGLRFNPTQADLDLYPDKFSWGYRIISLVRYESVLPGISFQPMIIWQHDVNGTAPAPLDVNFVQGRKTATINFEIRYKSALSLTPGYTWFSGAGLANNLKDRDYLQIFAKYQF